MSTEWIHESVWRISRCPLYCSFNFYVGLKFFKQKDWGKKILSTQGSNLGLQHFRQILYHLSHQGSLNWKVGGSPNFWMMVPKMLSLISLVLPKEQQSLQDLKASEMFKGGSVWWWVCPGGGEEGGAGAARQDHDYGVKYLSFRQGRGSLPSLGSAQGRLE